MKRGALVTLTAVIDRLDRAAQDSRKLCNFAPR
jgi:hypothetical protein